MESLTRGQQRTEYMREWREKNQEKKKELNTAWYEKNRERFLTKYTCDVCGRTGTIKNKERHEASKKHQEALNK